MNLDDWLDYQQRVHPRAIALGLDRVRKVWTRLGTPEPAPVVITVGGTNGKGSTVAFLEAMLRAAGKRVGAYTSPHLLRYNERVRIDGADVDDAAFVDAFERIEAARGDVALTYFEYGTLAALLLFARREARRPRCSKSVSAAGSTRSISSTQTRRSSRRSTSITRTGSATSATASGARRPASFAPGVRRSSASSIRRKAC